MASKYDGGGYFLPPELMAECAAELRRIFDEPEKAEKVMMPRQFSAEDVFRAHGLGVKLDAIEEDC